MQQMVRLFPLKAEGEVADEGTLFFINIAFKNKNDVINKHEAEKKSLYVFFPPLISFTLNKAQLITLTYTFTTKGGGGKLLQNTLISHVCTTGRKGSGEGSPEGSPEGSECTPAV